MIAGPDLPPFLHPLPVLIPDAFDPWTPDPWPWICQPWRSMDQAHAWPPPGLALSNWPELTIQALEHAQELTRKGRHATPQILT